MKISVRLTQGPPEGEYNESLVSGFCFHLDSTDDMVDKLILLPSGVLLMVRMLGR